MAITTEATHQELVNELEKRGFVIEGEFSQNSAFMEAVAAAMKTVITRDAEVVIKSGISAGTYKIT